MPRVKRRSKRFADNFSEEELRHLTEGFSLIGKDRFGQHGEHNMPLIEEAWKLIGESLTRVWIAEHPGSRPWGWWRFDAPERRQRIDGVQHPFDNAIRKDHVERVAMEHPSFHDRAYALDFGKPSCLIGAIKDDFSARYEGELAYLDRLNLLTPWERHVLYGEPLPEESDNATSEA